MFIGEDLIKCLKSTQQENLKKDIVELKNLALLSILMKTLIQKSPEIRLLFARKKVEKNWEHLQMINNNSERSLVIRLTPNFTTVFLTKE